MIKKNNSPNLFNSEFITYLKQQNTRNIDESAQNELDITSLEPIILDYSNLRIILARHFGFCFGVKRAIEIAYRAVAERPHGAVFLVSEMIHNPLVTKDLQACGVKFLKNDNSDITTSLNELTEHDTVIVPAFGITTELRQQLSDLGIDTHTYDTTCPFVQKVWKRAKRLGQQGYSVIIHGKASHEETRATFSHTKAHAPTLVIRDEHDAKLVARVLKQQVGVEEFWKRFHGHTSDGFDPAINMDRVGVVNQTTMLASETKTIVNILKQAYLEKFGEKDLQYHFAETNDTLCYATYQNQQATQSLIAHGADCALVVGGYNSSNTSHLADMCAKAMPTYRISHAEEILSRETIRNYDSITNTCITTTPWCSTMNKSALKTSIAITAGASCPDIVVENVIRRLLELFQ